MKATDEYCILFIISILFTIANTAIGESAVSPL